MHFGVKRLASAAGEKVARFLPRAMQFTDLRDPRVFNRKKFRFVKDRPEVMKHVDHYYLTDYPHAAPLVSNEVFRLSYVPALHATEHRKLRESIEGVLRGATLVASASKFRSGSFILSRESDGKVVYSSTTESLSATFNVESILVRALEYD